MKANILFIGGPLNGRKDIRAQYEIYIEKNDSVFTKEHRYIRHHIHGALIYIHESLSMAQAIEKLVSCYRGGKRKK
jgi:hypothetical protein